MLLNCGELVGVQGCESLTLPLGFPAELVCQVDEIGSTAQGLAGLHSISWHAQAAVVGPSEHALQCCTIHGGRAGYYASAQPWPVFQYPPTCTR